jgi:hypothetical protein
LGTGTGAVAGAVVEDVLLDLYKFRNIAARSFTGGAPVAGSTAGGGAGAAGGAGAGTEMVERVGIVAVGMAAVVAPPTSLSDSPDDESSPNSNASMVPSSKEKKVDDDNDFL